ncbi:MAG: alpha/beta hydrolase, partial [Parvularculaceae bacterium]|nr:alpha/beta hydrolase [Parvularculaceae bacterium]
LVVFPGAPSRKYLFDRFLPRAPQELEVVLLMRTGYGRGVGRPYTDFNDQIAAAAPFLEDDKKVVALGVSYGGALAMKLALERPDKVAGVVAVAALVGEPRSYVQPFADLGGAPGVRNVLPRHLHLARAELAGRRPQIGPLFARLKAYRRPVRILHGDADHLVPLSDAHLLRTYFAADADVSIDVVKGGTHFLEMQAPMRLYGAVDAVMKAALAGGKKVGA